MPIHLVPSEASQLPLLLPIPSARLPWPCRGNLLPPAEPWMTPSVSSVRPLRSPLHSRLQLLPSLNNKRPHLRKKIRGPPPASAKRHPPISTSTRGPIPRCNRSPAHRPSKPTPPPKASRAKSKTMESPSHSTPMASPTKASTTRRASMPAPSAPCSTPRKIWRRLCTTRCPKKSSRRWILVPWSRTSPSNLPRTTAASNWDTSYSA
mmetsp:Transcript_29132/g.62738  ORF Transcript_29132/g.62738 Transcript_29132/m.62738 type:complete len:207 (-) Transcript_29132:615-1235(-)